jgi:hypothetical protein
MYFDQIGASKVFANLGTLIAEDELNNGCNKIFINIEVRYKAADHVIWNQIHDHVIWALSCKTNPSRSSIIHQCQWFRFSSAP